MACEAAGRGIPRQELYRAAVARLAEPGFDSREIAAVVKSAYSRATREEAPDAPSLCHESAKLPIVAQFQTDGGEEERLWDEKIGGESLREHTPTFPESVFEALPALLREAMVYTKEPRERDVLLLGLLTAVSACLPQVQGFYHHKSYWPNLYTFVVAAAASNKSVLEYAYALFQVYVEQAMCRNQELRRQYEADLEAYQKAERQAARRQSSSASSAPQLVTPGPAAVAPPEEPRYFYPHIPGDTSKARILHHVRENGDRGGLLFETEADTLSGQAGLWEFLRLPAQVFPARVYLLLVQGERRAYLPAPPAPGGVAIGHSLSAQPADPYLGKRALQSFPVLYLPAGSPVEVCGAAGRGGR